MNVAYQENEKRSFLKLNAISLLFTLAAILGVVILTSVVVVVPIILSYLNLGVYDWLIRFASFAILAIGVAFGLGMLYRFGPSRETARWHWLPVGAIFATVSVLIVSAGYSFYVANFANYNATYGSLGAIIGFMTLIWLTLTVVMLGAELNAELEHQTSTDTTTPPTKAMGDRGAYVADHVGRSMASGS